MGSLRRSARPSFSLANPGQRMSFPDVPSFDGARKVRHSLTAVPEIPANGARTSPMPGQMERNAARAYRNKKCMWPGCANDWDPACTTIDSQQNRIKQCKACDNAWGKVWNPKYASRAETLAKRMRI